MVAGTIINYPKYFLIIFLQIILATDIGSTDREDDPIWDSTEDGTLHKQNCLAKD